MSDEERRAIEREARYSENLSNFLTCMREGHIPGQYSQGRDLWAPNRFAKAGRNVTGKERYCDRCLLVFLEVSE